MLEVGSELEVGQVSLCGKATNQTGTFPAPSPNLHLGKNTPQVHEEAHFESDLLDLKQGKNLARDMILLGRCLHQLSSIP